MDLVVQGIAVLSMHGLRGLGPLTEQERSDRRRRSNGLTRQRGCATALWQHNHPCQNARPQGPIAVSQRMYVSNNFKIFTKIPRRAISTAYGASELAYFSSLTEHE